MLLRHFVRDVVMCDSDESLDKLLGMLIIFIHNKYGDELCDYVHWLCGLRERNDMEAKAMSILMSMVLEPGYLSDVVAVYGGRFDQRDALFMSSLTMVAKRVCNFETSLDDFLLAAREQSVLC